MKVKVTFADLVKIRAFDTMRHIAYSKAKKEYKEAAVSEVFEMALKLLEEIEGGKR